ncbi:MAG: cytochrome C [Planctomycetota bacterium]
MEHAKHIIRAVLLLVLSTVVFVFVRHFLIPESFGMYGHYRFANVAEHASKTPQHGAPGTCAECHDKEAKTLSGGQHRSVSCEVCHAPLGNHVQGGERVAQMPAQRSYLLCARCHERLAARPKEFPQIVLSEHASVKGAKLSEDVCWECHEDAHNPTGE